MLHMVMRIMLVKYVSKFKELILDLSTSSFFLYILSDLFVLLLVTSTSTLNVIA